MCLWFRGKFMTAANWWRKDRSRVVVSPAELGLRFREKTCGDSFDWGIDCLHNFFNPIDSVGMGGRWLDGKYRFEKQWNQEQTFLKILWKCARSLREIFWANNSQMCLNKIYLRFIA